MTVDIKEQETIVEEKAIKTIDVQNNILKSVKTLLNKFINSIWFVIIIGILIFLKTLLFYKSTIAINEPLALETIIGTMTFIIMIVCFLCVLPNRTRAICGMMLNLSFSILLFGDNVYYIYSNSVLSIAQITNLQYGEEIISTLPMVLELKQILYFVDIIALLILFVFKILKLEKKAKKTKKQLIGKAIIGVIGILIFCMVGIQYVEKGTQKSYNKDMQIREASIFGYHISDFSNLINIKKQTKYKKYEDMIEDYNQLKNEYQEKYGEEKYNFEGILKDKNIIILQLESVQEFVVNTKINGKEITPNLNKFINENIKISDMNMQSYSTTADSEHSTITSLYPMENGMSFSKYYTNTYDDLFKIFNNANYHTSYMHGNYPYFWNRGNVYGRLNLDELSLKEQFDDLSENINGDLSDELLYRQAVQKLKTYENPFISYIVAASSHTPYTLEGLQDRSKVSIDVGKYKDTYFGNYLESMNYADYAFGIFIEELKKEELHEDTAILVFGDHNGLSMYDEEMMDFLKQINSNMTDVDLKINYTSVACGFKIPGINNIEIDKSVNKLDIKPTLAYLCDIEDVFSLGTNMFENKPFICLNNERIISYNYYYDEEWYNRITGEKVDINTLEENIKIMLQSYFENMKVELDISNSISVNNLLK